MSATDILKLCDEVLAASKEATPQPWHDNHWHDEDDMPFTTVETVDEKIICSFNDMLNAHYVAIAANTAPALAEYIRCLHSAAAARGIDIDTWDLPRQPR